MLRPTSNLRFVARTSDGQTRKVLQQFWLDDDGVVGEWRDVELAEESIEHPYPLFR